MGCIWFDVCWCYVAVWLWWCGIRMQAETLVPQPAYEYHNRNVTPTHIEPDTTHEVTQRISRKLLRMDVLTSETCWALNKVIIKQVASSWSLFTQPQRDVPDIFVSVYGGVFGRSIHTQDTPDIIYGEVCEQQCGPCPPSGHNRNAPSLISFKGPCVELHHRQFSTLSKWLHMKT